MNEELYRWLNRKPTETVSVRWVIGGERSGQKTSSPVEETFQHSRSSTFFSSLAIVGGAVMAGLFMGWTVWTLLGAAG